MRHACGVLARQGKPQGTAAATTLVQLQLRLCLAMPGLAGACHGDQHATFACFNLPPLLCMPCCTYPAIPFLLTIRRTSSQCPCASTQPAISATRGSRHQCAWPSSRLCGSNSSNSCNNNSRKVGKGRRLQVPRPPAMVHAHYPFRCAEWCAWQEPAGRHGAPAAMPGYPPKQPPSRCTLTGYALALRVDVHPPFDMPLGTCFGFPHAAPCWHSSHSLKPACVAWVVLQQP